MMPEHRQYPSESLYTARSKVYNLGLLGLLCSFILFIIGFSSQSWIHFDRWDDVKNIYDNTDMHYEIDYNPNERYAGLWNSQCMPSGSACNTGILVAQIAFSFHLAGYIISLAVAAYENCKKADPASYYSRILEICVFITGILGTAGIAVFVVWYSTSFPHNGLRWSFIMTSLSLIGIYITFFLIFFGNRRQFVSTRGTVLLLPQQPGVIYYNTGNPSNATVVQNYQLHQMGNQPQTQPLLPQQPQPYFYPPINHHPDAPPAYSLPPAYPLLPSQPQSYAYPIYHEYPQEGRVHASAPPYDSTLPQKS